MSGRNDKLGKVKTKKCYVTKQGKKIVADCAYDEASGKVVGIFDELGNNITYRAEIVGEIGSIAGSFFG